MSNQLEASPGEGGAQSTGQASLPQASWPPRPSSPGIHPLDRGSPKGGEGEPTQSARPGALPPLTRVRGLGALKLSLTSLAGGTLRAS